jgi:transposase
MQDNAPAYKSKSTIEDFAERGIHPVNWPPFSPDLNPIEYVWKWMKDWIERNAPLNVSRDALRQAVKDAWDAVPEDFLLKLIKSMPERMQRVVDAHGGHTKY